MSQDPLNSRPPISLATALSRSMELVSVGWDGRAELFLHTSLPPPLRPHPSFRAATFLLSLSLSPLPGKHSLDSAVNKLPNLLYDPAVSSPPAPPLCLFATLRRAMGTPVLMEGSLQQQG
uniref:Uncharacterized protein n=1 Tax=Sphaerodactylus townsendi TaxID=933632 RepID=A0ACB8F9D9_9SAUR